MADQLEIISPNADITFHTLDATKGIVNLGSHPENDIVLAGPKISPFHIMLDHRQKPYQLMVLGIEGQTRVGSEVVLPNMPRMLQGWETLEVEGYSIILIEDETAAVVTGDEAAVMDPSLGVVPAMPTTMMPPSPLMPAMGAPTKAATAAGAAAAASGAATTAAPPKAPTAMIGARRAHRPPDRDDEFIVVEMSERERTIDVDQVAFYQLTIVNGGKLVANFQVIVDGLNPEWVNVDPDTINLNEGGRQIINLSINPPRQPTSTAGAHHFAIIVTSSDYPEHANVRGATVTVNPYYDFVLSEVSPRQQTVSWNQPRGAVTMTLTNRGNSLVAYRVEGEDDEERCAFDFSVDDGDATLTRRVELYVQPTQTATIPVHIFAKPRRRLFGTRRHYTLTFTAEPMVGQQLPRSVRGDLYSVALLGFWATAMLLLLLLLCGIGSTMVIFNPTIENFVIVQSDNREVKETTINSGGAVKFKWKASPWADLRIDQQVGPVEGPEGLKDVKPLPATTNQLETITYRLTSDNWLSRIYEPWWGSHAQTVKVNLSAVFPEVKLRALAADGRTVTAPGTITVTRGQELVLSWEVGKNNTDSVVLSANGVPLETLQSPKQSETRNFKPDQNTSYQVDSINRYGKAPASVQVKVEDPPAVIQRFSVNPQIIVAGTPVALEWEVQNAPAGGVRIYSVGSEVQGLGKNQAAKGFSQQSPAQYTEYVLDPSNGADISATIRVVQVFVTPAPRKPLIKFFIINNNSVVRGSPEADDVVLSWEVEGDDTTQVEISGPDFGSNSSLPKAGRLKVPALKTTFFVLKALNGPFTETSQPVELRVIEPSPTPTLTPTPTDTPTPTPTLTPTPTPTFTPTPTPVPPTPTPLPPQINSFRAEANPGTSPNDFTQVASSSPDRLKYQVIAGTIIKLSWQVANATEITLDPGFGPQSPQGELPNQFVRGSLTYKLTAKNGATPPVTVIRYVEIEAIAKVPPAPFNLRGTDGVTSTTIIWDYSIAATGQISGFRIYRADVPPGSAFNPVKEVPPSAPTISTTDSAICGKAYYVTAFYIDIVTLQPRETARTSQTWFSKACPTPTPKP